MKIGVLSANPKSWRMQQFMKAAREQNVKLLSINPFRTSLDIKNGKCRVRCEDINFKELSSSIHGGNRQCFPYVLLLLQHMEGAKIPLTASSEAVWKTRNKFATLQVLLHAGIPVPNSTLTYSQELALKRMSKMHQPVVIKLLESSSGRGVMRAKNFEEIEGLTGTLKALDQMIFLQEFINSGEDIRAFVVGNEVVSSMKRKGSRGMWKTNISLGGRGIKINLSKEMEEMAIKTCDVLGTKICGVDIIEDKDGPKVLEANITPGFEGLVKYTGVNPAPKIIKLAKEIAKK